MRSDLLPICTDLAPRAPYVELQTFLTLGLSRCDRYMEDCRQNAPGQPRQTGFGEECKGMLGEW